MGSDPQYAKYPNLSLAQDIFTLTNPASAQTSQQSSMQKLQNAIYEHKMAPLYRYLAHPSDGILNASGEGMARKSAANSNKPNGTASMVVKRRNSGNFSFHWDEAFYEKLKAENEEELENIQKEEDEADEKAGDTEVQAAKGKRAELWARLGDKVRRLECDTGWSQEMLKKPRKKHFHRMKRSSKRPAFSAPRSISFSQSYG